MIIKTLMIFLGFKMKTVYILEHFSSVCGDGNRALLFLNSVVFPALGDQKELCLDFNGIRVINASFSNALFGNLLRAEGRELLSRLKIVNARAIVKSEIKSGIAYGLKYSDLSAVA